jgi:hypothetical protein
MRESNKASAEDATKVPGFLVLCGKKSIVRRALATSLIVGTILVVINHGDALMSGKIDAIRLFRILLTYLVPYFVSTTSSVSTILSIQSTQDGIEGKE